ncbi:Uncharacterized membrane protein HdeD, DUF308 family [Arboricoccus pini]|uniref:Uncharacterized membrane protein HdeD, DUF308 family n=1 Tax=Arboricoccus pini TaxID=1963835 RepID=A0A212QR90_9PROT|nr:HdeD family acid-resistance protein [Arboricoccus pini]SNB62088.1 Uncharacterized membrane protein HdeD, DUF308 family [Arboricoccus pini]
MAEPSRTPSFLGPDLTALHLKWGWFVVLGVVLLILGLIALGNLFEATIVSIYYLGALMLLGGIAEVIHAFGVKTWGRFAYWLLSGLIYCLAGILAFVNPLLASAVLTLVLAISLIVAGILRLVAGFSSPSGGLSGWIVLSGIITLLAGLVVAVGWPVNSLFILGLLLAIDLIFQGWASVALGLAMRRLGGDRLPPANGTLA